MVEMKNNKYKQWISILNGGIVAQVTKQQKTMKK